MQDLFQNASDDQIALLMCGAALLISGAVMYVSRFAGQLAEQRATVPLRRTAPAPRDVETRERAA